MKKMLAPILEPVLVNHEGQDEEKEYAIWPWLTVRDSEQGVCAGLGVFATHEIFAGLKIPIYGTMLTQEDFDQKEEQNKVTHVYANNVPGTPFLYLDGNPDQSPYMSVGGRGMYIVMMINEPKRGRGGGKKPNCIFKGLYVQVASKLEVGDELTISYGADSYKRNGYIPSNSSLRKCVYPRLAKFV
jgi:hypothetical protein